MWVRQSCAEMQGEGQGWWVVQGSTAQHPAVQDQCQSLERVPWVSPGGPTVRVQKTHNVKTGMVMKRMRAVISDTAVTAAFC